MDLPKGYDDWRLSNKDDDAKKKQFTLNDFEEFSCQHCGEKSDRYFVTDGKEILCKDCLENHWRSL